MDIETAIASAMQESPFVRRYRRQATRYHKREMNAANYAVAGLNGKRAVARRQRQIAAGQLKVTA